MTANKNTMNMAEKKIDVYLADLTHSGGVLSANFFPLGIGCVGASLAESLSEKVTVELFRYPDDLSNALTKRIPQVIGFANYSWNLNISYEYIKRIKQKNPETIIVMGGPNYGLSKKEMADFWEHYPLVDFHIVFEGEIAIIELIKTLESVNFDVSAIKKSRKEIPNCHYSTDGIIIEGQPLPRVKDLNELPSPYLTGMMDKFFDGQLVPLIFSTRGCPFKCSFCNEGNDYYNKVSKRTDLYDELHYIGKRISPVKEVCVADANFGMYKEDVEKAKAIAEVQEKYGWPGHMYVSTGKNQKERVVEVASILNGAMFAGGAIQSTDPVVLENVKRSNISLDQLTSDCTSDSYTEIILALPGDSVRAHTKTLKDMLDAGVNKIRMYQLILLPQTEMNTDEARRKFEMQTKFRLMPRSYGKYEVFGETFSAIEYEEICISNNTLPFDDYKECRKLDLTVEILNNGDMFRELSALCLNLNISWFDVVVAFHNSRGNASAGMQNLYKDFIVEFSERLWETRQELENDVKKNIDGYLNRDDGTNEMSKARAIAVFRLQDGMHDLLYRAMEEQLAKNNLLDSTMKQYIKELKIFSQLRKTDLLNTSSAHEAYFTFDFQKISDKKFLANPKDFLLDQPVKYIFKHSDVQTSRIKAYIEQYGTSLDGLGRILMRSYVKTLFRTPYLLSQIDELEFADEQVTRS